jgi:5-hydroxyisourate hydrolase
VSSLSSHVLDLISGRPAVGVSITLERRADDGGYREIAHSESDERGRLRTAFPEDLGAGIYRLRFDTAAYFAAQRQRGLYPEVNVVLQVDRDQHYHIPLLLGPHGYTTYRGS